MGIPVLAPRPTCPLPASLTLTRLLPALTLLSSWETASAVWFPNKPFFLAMEWFYSVVSLAYSERELCMIVCLGKQCVYQANKQTNHTTYFLPGSMELPGLVSRNWPAIQTVVHCPTWLWGCLGFGESTRALSALRMNHIVLTAPSCYQLEDLFHPQRIYVGVQFQMHSKNPYRHSQGRMFTYRFFSLFSSLEAASQVAWIGQAGRAWKVKRK